jgi:haloalkane dehalogenase
MPVPADPLPLRHVEVLGRRMAWAEAGEGPPILFQHGNPTSSYLWRNIMPRLADLGRCIAVDLIGMGGSEKLPDSGPGRYSVAEHARHLEAAWDALGVTGDAVLVLHDWGSALGFDWARRHPDRVRGLAYMEAIVRPIPGWQDWPENARPIFQALRSEAGEQMILDKNVFVERILPASVLRGLTEEEMTHYRAPFAEPGEGRRPTLDFPREIPIAGEPPEVAEMVSAYADWLSVTDTPKLFVNAEPGSILTGPQRDFCRGFPNQTEVTVPGSHFIQEDSPEQIAEALRAFISGLRA